MPGIRVGAKPVRRVMLGAPSGRRVSRIMLGNRRVFSPTTIFDDFNGDDGALDKGGRPWVNCGPSLDYVCSVVGGRMRVGVPDNLAGLVERISYMRHTGGALPGNDGYIECLVATPGDSITSLFGTSPFVTQVFGRATANAGAGAGIHLAGSRLGLVARRNAVTESVVAWFGGYSPGDVIRLEYEGTVYRMLRNGALAGPPWNDAGGQIATGTGNRSLVVRADGAKEFLGPRRFSAALDFVEMGELG